MNPYRPDLAFIHDDGFGHFAHDAAEALIAALRQGGIHTGTVVELGCGSGITARKLTDAGYAVFGIDLSEAFVALARRRVPEATFRVGSFVGAGLPPCVAVCAIGEVLNYAFDERNDGAARFALFADVYAALAAGGVFLFDMAGPDRAPATPNRMFVEREDWAVLAETSGQGRELTRRITTYHRHGDLVSRATETHRLLLTAPGEVEAELRKNGFDVERTEAYAGTPLPPGLHGFVARKPPAAL
jgi:SAM-dependent methyltransferase